MEATLEQVREERTTEAPKPPAVPTREEIIELLRTNDRAVARALVILFKRQTPDEQASKTTRWSNGQGFTAFDAKILSSFARQVLKGWRLSPKQLAVCRRPTRGGIKLGKYWRQLQEAAEAKAARRVDPKAKHLAPEPV